MQRASSKSQNGPSYVKYKTEVQDALYKIGWSAKATRTMTDRITQVQWKYLDEQAYRMEETIKYIVTPHEDYTESLYEFLIECGFRKKPAKYWSELVDFESYTVHQELDFIIEVALKPYQPVSLHRYLYQPETENVWYKIKDNHVQFYNCEHVERAEEALASFPIHTNPGTEQLYFHCTNYKSAQNIMRQGVKHVKGRECLDFGILPSFYLTPELQTAMQYATYLSPVCKNEVCILVFKMPGVLSKKYKRLQFETANKEWEQLTADSRRCEDDRNKLDDYDFVLGPMVANVKQISSEKSKPHNPPKIQFASKTDKADAFLTKSLSAVVWMAKN